MSNVRTISQEDLDKYPSLSGKKVGDTITAEEDAKLREGKSNIEVTVPKVSRGKKK
jgi:hypothetical protein